MKDKPVPRMSRVRAHAYMDMLKKSHAHRSDKDYDRKKSKKKLAKELDM